MRRLALALLLLLLSSCSSGPSVLPEDRDVCRGRGLEQGTPAFESCTKAVAEKRWRYWGWLANRYPPG